MKDSDEPSVERNKMSQAAQFAAMKLIEANGRREGQYWQYNDGWNDIRIANEVNKSLGANYSETSIAYRRTQIFGKLKPLPGSGGTRETHAVAIGELRIADQARRVEIYQLQRRIEHMEKALNIVMIEPNRDIMKAKLQALSDHFNKK